MFKLKFFPLVMMSILLSSCFKNYPVMVGDERVLVRVLHGSSKTYVHVHQNEVTALRAAKVVVREQGGTLITLAHRGGRNIVFHHEGQRYAFDPNRIFSPQGIRKTLEQYSTYTKSAATEVDRLASAIKALLPAGKVVAVHNNKDYSLKNYLPGHDLAHEARRVNYAPQHYYRNFYLVTQRSDFLRLKNSGNSCVLQKTNATNDGSLSIYLKRRHYINVEAGYSEFFAQLKMLRLA